MQVGETSYNRLTPLMCARLAAPHTWPGPSVLTTVFGGVLSLCLGYAFDAYAWCVLLLCAVSAQAAVNTLNDWADYRAGTDTAENSDDPTDAVLVYDRPNPTHVLVLGIGYMLVAAVSGVACCVWAGTAVPVCIGVVGGIFIVCYSSGKLPVSYLPLGEVASGVVMGCLIPLAVVCVFAAHTYGGGAWGLLGAWNALDWLHLVVATAPFVLGVALIMATQNGSDIERDEPVGRHTLAVVLGRRRFRALYRVVFVLWIASVLHLVFWGTSVGGVVAVGRLWPAVVCLLLGLGTIRAVLLTPLTHEVRGPSMGAVNKANLFVNGGYCLALMAVLMGV